MNIYKASCHCGCAIRIQMKEEFEGQIYCGLCTKLIMNTKTTTDIEENLQRIDKYLLLKLLKHAPIGNLYLAYNNNRQSQVSLTILRFTNETICNYLCKQITLLMQLSHLHIVKIKDCGIYQNRVYFVTELLQGETLADRLQREIFPIRRALKIAYHVLDALEYAHHKSVLHYSVTPNNVFISMEGLVKLQNFQIARAIFSSSSESIHIPKYLEYIAPEQLKDQKNATIHSDIYSVGALLFHCLCGCPPYAECNKILAQVMFNKERAKHVKIQQRKPGLPPAVIEIIDKAMAHHPSNRYQNCSQMKEAVYDLIAVLPK